MRNCIGSRFFIWIFLPNLTNIGSAFGILKFGFYCSFAKARPSTLKGYFCYFSSFAISSDPPSSQVVSRHHFDLRGLLVSWVTRFFCVLETVIVNVNRPNKQGTIDLFWTDEKTKAKKIFKDTQRQRDPGDLWHL